MRDPSAPSTFRMLFRRATSIRGKIAAGYVVGFLFLFVLASVLFANLIVLEDRFGSYSGISRLLDTTLEMRRYEKNYLLYGDVGDLDAAISYASTARSILSGADLGVGARTPAWLRLLAGLGPETEGPAFDPEETARLFEHYGALLGLAQTEGGAPPDVVDALREQGRQITLIAERLASVEGRKIQTILRSGRRTLVVLVVLFLVGTALIARWIRTTALRPLEELERGMHRIASGELRMLPVGSGNDEIASMNAAFNRMIREIFEHRQEVMRSERLASLGTMLAGIAHEINNPLSNVSTSAELLDEENETLAPEERRELIRQIVSQTDRATEIIRTVLEYSREPRLERQPTNLLSVLFDTVILVRGELPTHVSVDLDVAPDLEVMGHKTKLQQAFINLVTNSIDAMQEAGREGAITVSASSTPGSAHVELVFRDSGVGIPRHIIDRIFDPFFSTKDVGHGTGLGLYVTHQIVEQHGGTIRVESEVGKGTTVTIRLPRFEPSSASTSDEARLQGGG